MSHFLDSPTAQVLSTILIVAFALLVIFIRLRAARKPTSIRKIIMPPLGMVTGFLMFIFPVMRISLLYGVCAFAVGCLFSLPLIRSSRMEYSDGKVYLKRSPGFIIVLFALLIVRIVLGSYIEQYITIPQTGAIFFILAFGMLLPWRITMFQRYKSFVGKLSQRAV